MKRKQPPPPPGLVLPVGATISFTLQIRPATKKTSNQLVNRHSARPRVLPSEQYRQFERAVVAWALQGHAVPIRGSKSAPIDTNRLQFAQPLNCAAKIYRSADRGDTIGFMQALADALQKAGVLADDKWIKTWDGSEPLLDRENPRIEVTLTALDPSRFETPKRKRK